MPIPVTDIISTTSPTDTYATHDASLGRGGHRTVNTVSDLSNISAARKVEGMLVYVKSTQKTYKLLPDLTSWEEFGTFSWAQSDW